MREKKNVNINLVGKSQEIWQIGIHKRWEYGIKISLRDTGDQDGSAKSCLGHSAHKTNLSTSDAISIVPSETVLIMLAVKSLSVKSLKSRRQ
jgi:hypothetical protein